MNEKERLSAEEQRLFDQLPREKEPPAKLEERILSKMRREGLVKKKAQHAYLRYALAAAASLTIFFSGILYERYFNPAEIDPANGYMLLLSEDHNFRPLESSVAMVEEYKRWTEYTNSLGVEISGQELKEEVLLVSKEGVNSVQENERITGYFILEAESIDEAVAVAETNPHIKYGGRIAVKRFLTR